MQKTLLVIFIFLVHASLLSETKKGPYFFEIAYGEGFNYLNSNPTKIDNNAMNREVTYHNLDIFGFYAANGTAEDKLLSYYAFEKAPKPTISGQNSSFLFEYVMKSKFGIGFSLNDAQFQASNLSITKFEYGIEAGILSTIVPGLQNITYDQLTKVEILLPYLTYHNNELAKIRTMNLHFSYHFLESSSFDPYIRFSFGFGRDSISNSKIFQSSLIIGSRYFITNRVYLLGELVGTNYDAYSKEFEFSSLKEKETHRWSLQEYSSKFGIGLNL
ncbi:hypothetical protein AB3N59_06335 [Leptospira sp. WS92.C1]